MGVRWLDHDHEATEKWKPHEQIVGIDIDENEVYVAASLVGNESIVYNAFLNYQSEKIIYNSFYVDGHKYIPLTWVEIVSHESTKDALRIFKELCMRKFHMLEAEENDQVRMPD